MEPMTLGSPVGSPSSQPTSPFLPAFLMGEPATSPGTITLAKSPTLSGKQLHFGTPTTPSNNQDLRSIRPTATVLHATEKGSGPPTRGLFDPEDAYQPIQSPQHLISRFDGSYVQNISPAPTFFTAAPSQMDGYWVTVFGFPCSAASHILSQFAQYGTVLASRSSPRGNWVHVKYQSAIEARKALSTNGKVFGGSFMVGVIPCNDPDIIADQQDKENLSTTEADGFVIPHHLVSSPNVNAYRGANLNTSLRYCCRYPGSSQPNYTFRPPGSTQERKNPYRFRSLEDEEEELTDASSLFGDASILFGDATESNNGFRRTCRPSQAYGSPLSPRMGSVRPLAQAYRAAQHPTEVIYSHAVPQRSTSFVGKAMEYFFGW